MVIARINENDDLQAYYATLESRLGYRWFLGDTRHFGYYDSERSFPLRINQALRRMESELLAALDLPSSSRVLDAGCGVGHVAIHMASEGNLTVEGIDVVQRHVGKASANVKAAGLCDRISIQHGDYHHLDTLFEAEQFDGVYTMETFVHATDPSAVLKQFLRVLKPGGHLAMMEYDHIDYDDPKNSKEQKATAKAMKSINQHAAMPANQAFNQGVLEDLLVKAGFENIQVQDLSRRVWPMLWLFYVVAWLPYKLVRLFGQEKRFVNTVAGYWSWKGRRTWRYVKITARKPPTT